MKTHLVRYGYGALFVLSIICSSGTSQTTPTKRDNSYDCEKQPLGLFRQITVSSLEQLSYRYDRTFVIDDDSYLSKDRWPLDVLDEVDPAYKFDLIRNPSEAGKKRCGRTVEAIGKLISPTGRLFEFKQATYDIRERKLRFTTIERDGITYEAEIQFFPAPILVNKMYQDGTLKLKATGKSLGTVLIESPFTSWNSH